MESRLSVVAVVGVSSLLGYAAYDQAVVESSTESLNSDTFAIIDAVATPSMELLPLIALVLVAAAGLSAIRSLA
jgi:Cu/Ag efflux pump CusA